MSIITIFYFELRMQIAAGRKIFSLKYRFFKVIITSVEGYLRYKTIYDHKVALGV